MKTLTDICYAESNPEACRLDLYLPEGERFSAFLYFHGGGLEAGGRRDAEPFAPYLCQRGIAVVSVDYRMYPGASYPDFIRDCAKSVAWAFRNLGNYGVCERYFVGGSSAGAYISMMLCFDPSYLAECGVDPKAISGFFHDAGQPTCHFNVLRERGLDPRRVIVDEAAPLFHVRAGIPYPPMRFLVSDHDMECRYEQTLLMLSTLKHFGVSNASLKVLHGNHCHYIKKQDENGDSVLGKLVMEFIEEEMQNVEPRAIPNSGV